MAQLLHMSARYCARNPVVSAARAFGRGRGGIKSRAKSRTRLRARLRGVGNFSVEGHRRLQRDQRFAQPDVLGKAFIQLLGFRFEQAHLHGDSRPTEFRKSLTGHAWIGILHGADHAADSGRDHGIGTGPGASLMRAGFQIQIESSAPRTIAGLFQRDDFGVLHAVIGVRARANFAARGVQHNRAHGGIRRHQANARSR